MSAIDPPAVVRWTMRLEDASALDVPVRALEPLVQKLFSADPQGPLLRGEWLGHALHPVLTDAVLGTWTSASLLDLLGGRDAAPSAQRLVGLGLLAAAPTFWTGWAEWSGADRASQRVGVVHAVTNGVAIGSFAGSWVARRRGHHRAGKGLALVGAAALGVAGYLGGHLAHARPRTG